MLDVYKERAGRIDGHPNIEWLTVPEIDWFPHDDIYKYK
jgi:hypothetical protein